MILPAGAGMTEDRSLVCPFAVIVECTTWSAALSTKEYSREVSWPAAKPNLDFWNSGLLESLDLWNLWTFGMSRLLECG
jgi:hypothetical protein